MTKQRADAYLEAPFESISTPRMPRAMEHSMEVAPVVPPNTWVFLVCDVRYLHRHHSGVTLSMLCVLLAVLQFHVRMLQPHRIVADDFVGSN